MSDRPDCLFRWGPGRTVDLRLLRGLKPTGRGAGKLRVKVIQGMVWATRQQRGRLGHAKNGESKDWIFQAGEYLPEWVLGTKGRPAAGALGRLVLEAVIVEAGAEDRSDSTELPELRSRVS